MRLVQDSAMICELLFIYLVLRRLEISEDLFEISIFFFFLKDTMKRDDLITRSKFLSLLVDTSIIVSTIF